jgi:NodT family efflux transporter outer membrane factor (OMF) lipoprotein
MPIGAGVTRDAFVTHVRCATAPAFLLTMVLLQGCATVGPDYVPPTASAPTQWSTEMPGGLAGKPADVKTLGQWWTTLNDPTLMSLVDRALQGSLDLRQASARVREARARRGISAAERFPTLNASGAIAKTKSGEITGTGQENELYTAGFDASWEIDVFGGVRRSVEAAEAGLQASVEDLRDVLVTLLAEVALNYVEVRSLQTRLSVAEANRGAQAKTLQLVQLNVAAGEVSQLDLEQARSNLETTQSQIPTLETQLAQAKNRLAVLLGQTPGALNAELSKHQPVPVPPPEVAVGVPADVLRRRPDVRRAERELAAQTARVGVATTDLYPKFTLLGSIGLEALSFPSLFSGASALYTLGPHMRWNLFDAGRIRQNIEVQTARQEQALIAYEAAVLSALQDVEDALIAYGKEMIRRQSLLAAEHATRRTVEIAQNRYLAGESDFLSVLDAQRSLLTIQDQLAASNAQVTTNVISLYKALGGGWTTLAPEEAGRAQR